MALDPEVQKAVEETLGIESGKLSEVLASEDVHDVTVDKVVFLKKEDYDTRLQNVSRKAETTAIEMAVKKAKTENGLDFTGKDLGALITAAKTKAIDEAKIPVDEKLKKLQDDFGKLQTNYTTLEQTHETFKTEIQKKADKADVENEFTKHIPDNVIINKKAIFAVAKSEGYKLDKEDGKIVVKGSDGEIVKDTNLSPQSVKDFVTKFVTPYLKKATGGKKDGDDDDPSNPTEGSYEAFLKEADKNKWDDTKRNDEMAARIKAGTLKM